MTNPYAADTPDADERAAFQVGGIDRELSPEQQLEQLRSYIYAHYDMPAKNPPWSDDPSDPVPADTYDARLPDRITHTAMLMLGSALDHSMPGVCYPKDVHVSDIPALNAQLFTPSKPNGKWAISLHPGGWWKGSGVALENAWRPEVAAVAELSGVTILDLDYPLVPKHTLPQVIDAVAAATAWVREQGATWVGAWGYSSGGALAVLCAELFDALALTFPHLDLSMLPDAVTCDTTFPTTALPPTFMQVATHDTIAGHYDWFEKNEAVSVREYVSEHRISTPQVARERVRDVAGFLAEA
ncbi:MAG: alpha/beta hydrolase [Corynebacterium sp.]|uniref:alpha/beta hydrolase n=1 Tax=Corynebacterium sp. TaxID=1720 RepID=UPI0026DA6F11|nr:alpha/beta hydrolase [Corynebacterium sp.]MDO4762472.1 alpha/beta hydrolase [Corynebacterium sp.]